MHIYLFPLPMLVYISRPSSPSTWDNHLTPNKTPLKTYSLDSAGEIFLLCIIDSLKYHQECISGEGLPNVSSSFHLLSGEGRYNSILVSCLLMMSLQLLMMDCNHSEWKNSRLISALKLLKEYGLLGCKPVSTPMEPNSVLPYIPSKDDPLFDNITGYQKLLDKLIYLTHTLAHDKLTKKIPCPYATEYALSPLKSHLNCTLNVLRYLKSAPGKGIRYKFPNGKDNLCGYSDAY
ncbi:hypothetical protein Tco_0273275 [Tanacetum coccineum]